MKNKILFINSMQFGYNTDAYMHCYYLRDKFDIYYLCFDSGKKKIGMDGIKIRYISYEGSFFIRGIRFIIYSFFRLCFFRGLIFVIYFPGAIYLKKFLPWKKMILDIRSLGISPDSSYNIKFNSELKNTALLYDHITIISEGIRDKLGLPLNKTTILPLGANPVSEKKKQFKSLNLFYVGTLSNRDIEKTIYGLDKFIRRNNDVDITYDIVGDGHYNEIEELQELSKKLGLCNIVKIHGRIANSELKPFFDKCNVGVSFVPIRDYYEYQPVTKTFEYVMSGLYTIATCTHENKKVINDVNGILIKDNDDDFCRALEYIIKNRKIISTLNISNTLYEYKWEKIVNNRLYPLLIKLEKKWS